MKQITFIGRGSTIGVSLGCSAQIQLTKALQVILTFVYVSLVTELVAQPGTQITHSDVEYGIASREKLLLDIHVPEGEGPFPCAIYVHGGGWTGGDKANPDDAPALEMLAKAGFTWFSINYRLAPEHRWPACLNDVQTSIRWVKSNAAKYKGDPSRIVLMGYSAGGQLATYAATVVDESVQVQAVVGFAPLTDFVQELPKRGNILGRAQRGLLNRPEEITPESLGMLKALSPINYIRPGLPPFLLVHGDADGSVPYEQTIIFRNKLLENGVECDLITIPSGPHRLTQWKNYLLGYSIQVIAWLHETLEYREGIAANQQPNTIKIMPVGNSITAGEHYKFPPLEERTGYRKPLYEMLIGAGYNIDFVGSQKHGIRSEEDKDWYDWNCEAYPGWKIPDIAKKLDTALTIYQPDILLVHVGTNGKDWDKKPTQVNEMLDMINEHAIKNIHTVTVFLCLIINRFIEEDAAPTTQYNKDLASLVNARTGDKVRIIMVDMEKGAGLDYSDNLPDPDANPPYEGGDMVGNRYPGVAHDKYHPNDKGNIKMAVRFYEELVKVLPEPANTKN